MLRQMLVLESSMRTWQARLLAVLCAVMAGMWLIAAMPQQARPESSSDQVIVKFTSQSDAGQALARMDLAAIGDPTEDTRLNEIAEAFGERIGVPVRLESLTSGRELLLAVDHEALAVALAERLRQRDDVISAEVADSGNGTKAPRLAVAFEPESAFAKLVAGGQRVTLESLSGEGGSGLEVEAEVESSSEDHAVLALDLDALMSSLLERVAADPDVQYAQRNLRLAPYRTGGEGRG